MAENELLNFVCLGLGLSSFRSFGGDERLFGRQPGLRLHRLLGELEHLLLWKRHRTQRPVTNLWPWMVLDVYCPTKAKCLNVLFGKKEKIEFMSFLGSFETSFIIWINIVNQLDCFNQKRNYNHNPQNHIETFKVIFLCFTLELRSFAFVGQYSSLVLDIRILDVDIMVQGYTVMCVGESLGLLNPVNVYPKRIRCLKFI